MELSLRMIAQQAAFWWPPRAAAWNYVEFLVVFGSVAIAALKAHSDRTDLGFPAFGSLLLAPAPCSLCCPCLSSLYPPAVLTWSLRTSGKVLHKDTPQRRFLRGRSSRWCRAT